MRRSMAKPSEADIAAARAVLAAAATTGADAATKAMVELVTMPEFAKVEAAMRKAQSLNPANIDLSYTVGMLDRLRIAHTPA